MSSVTVTVNLYLTLLNFASFQFRQKDGSEHFQDWTTAGQ